MSIPTRIFLAGAFWISAAQCFAQDCSEAMGRELVGSALNASASAYYLTRNRTVFVQALRAVIPTQVAGIYPVRVKVYFVTRYEVDENLKSEEVFDSAVVHEEGDISSLKTINGALSEYPQGAFLSDKKLLAWLTCEGP